MFHAGALPWKPGYLALVAALALYIRVDGTGAVWERGRWMFVLFGALIMLSLVGAVVFYVQTGVLPGEKTFRGVVIYALAPAAFVAGISDRRGLHTYVLWFLAAFLGLNLLLEALREGAPFLVDFYRLGPQLARPEYQYRSMGIFENPNVTALTGSLLLVLVVAGMRRGAIAARQFSLVAAIWLTFVVSAFMVSRGELVAWALIVTVVMWRLRWRRAFRTGAVLAACLALTGWAAWTWQDQITDVFGFNVPGTVASRSLAVPDATRDVLAARSDDRVNSLMRPFANLGPAVERWRLSPLVGTGFEEATEVPIPLYHNDWLTVMVTAGVFGLTALVLAVFLLFRVDPLFAVPFLLPGAVNAFMFAPQHFTLFMLAAGLAAARRSVAERSETAGVDRPAASEELAATA